MKHRFGLVAVLSLVAPPLGACAPAGWMEADVDEPTIFAPDVVSTRAEEYGIAFTPDGREAYFTREPRRGPTRIFVTRFEDGRWTEPAPFGVETDEAPFITRDGSVMLFSSRRRMQGTWDRSENIWIMHRERDGWSEPEPLAGTVNRPGEEIDDYDVGAELGPTLLPNGALLYWTRTSPDWGSDIYVAEPGEDGAYVDPRPLRLNTPREESNPVVSPDGRYLIFQAYRSMAGYGDDDLYVSERTDYGWSEPRPLPEPINSGSWEGHPRFSPDGSLFFFSSDREQGPGNEDIYYVDVEALGLDLEEG